MGRTQGLLQVNPTCRKLPESLKHSSKFPFPFLLQPLGWDWARWGDLGEWGIREEINTEEVSTSYQPFFPGKHTCVPQEMTKTQIKEKLYDFQPIFPLPNFPTFCLQSTSSNSCISRCSYNLPTSPVKTSHILNLKQTTEWRFGGLSEKRRAAPTVNMHSNFPNLK